MPTRRSAALALALMLPAPSLGALAAFWFLPGSVGLAIYTLGKCVLYGTPALWSRFVDGEPWSRSPMRRGGWLWGFGSGLAIALAIFVAWVLLDRFGLETAALKELMERNGLDAPARFIASALWLMTVNALLEEYAFRWFVTTRWEALAPRGATFLSASSFTLHHVIVLTAFFPLGPALLASAGVFAGGFIWSLLYRRTRSIWPGWISHVIADAAILFIGWRILFQQPAA